MRHSGSMDLPLHGGKAPYWLLKRMKELSKPIFEILIYEYGTEGLLKRLSDPFFFQALSCVLAFDWHSSGTTTVLTGVLKSSINPEEFGIGFAGGKGKNSKNTFSDIEIIGSQFGLSDKKIKELHYTSKITAKIDSAAIQDGFDLYHHVTIFSDKGKWSVIQQGLNTEGGYARRYHWSNRIDNYIEEPHTGIVSDIVKIKTLDLTSKDSTETRSIIPDIIKEGPGRVRRLIESLIDIKQTSLMSFIDESNIINTSHNFDVAVLPKRVNWNILRDIYEADLKNFEDILAFKGMGRSTIKGLALISELIYGTTLSWKDPVKYSFAFGGKDGVPRPVNKKGMDDAAEILSNAIKEAKIGAGDKIKSLKNLRTFLGPYNENLTYFN
ncbi:MAG: hypothetical protein BWX56_00908 [Euryarchaeota archaeon ADurb.Bin023]|uniref:DUF763 domain-containing protein n=1 Tax=Candidatus Methanofastidiosum methylothiophilum TaxID=1705564 RepID=A0A150JLU8_9EURY|nr:MAG: hypothetical protein APG09_00504 [Candidatus Methanofastidiosum methylthiophilus]OQC51607.1 MAG: hypothetical protein BWX56_00908 [Euryarchaeota archaeon ADurb.Bin023]HPX25036.1 DUF763 domain-containing protein [Methanofastidiosum sp.]HQC25907.1 DUF763 domain-containing protein [Methanofastidiosum sp.]